MIVILDTVTITLLITETHLSDEAKECQEWLYKLLSRGVYVVAPEICDYEVRRGLLFIAKKKGKVTNPRIQDLNRLRESIDFLALSQGVLEVASEI